ncbi:MAG: efflux RND transporter periplasmic adaptor subunit [Bacteroidota bacterium]|nr:efflux RND transporter periplasmic adaptor subunit [Bacteroidota bacterium]
MKPEPVFVLILAFLQACGCQTKKASPETAEPAIPVIVSRVVQSPVENEISMSGNIEGFKTVRLGFMVAGKISYIAVNEGQTISKDVLLASLDPANYEIAKELADIQVNQVQDEYDRLKLMHDNKSLSESDFAKITYGLQQAKAQQKLHLKNLADTKLYSPIDGVLLKKLAETGEITSAGLPLFVVSDIRKVKVNAFVPESELHNIRIGQTAKVLLPSIDKTYEGKIIEVGSAADPSTRSFSLKIEVDNPGMIIRPGMIAEVSLISGTGSETLIIPVAAVRHDYNDQSFVFVVDSLNNKAFRRNVSLGNLSGDMIGITSGLNKNEIIVTGGQQKLVDGSGIMIQK